MKYLIGMVVLATVVNCPAPQQLTTPKQRYAELVCFKTSEKISGLNKICFYNCVGSEAAITVSSAELCPLSIKH
jgi:hypothetical protein